MKTGETYSLITMRQKQWASSHGICPEESPSWESHTPDLESNVYEPLAIKTLGEFERGEGKETSQKMLVLWSSSALVVNTFDYWRKGNRVRDIAQVFDPATSATDMEFESKQPVQRGGTPPHLDVVFTGINTKTIAIESKFTEPYRFSGSNLDKYLSNSTIWWGLDNLRAYTERIVELEKQETEYSYLGVPQLIKHILGLKRQDKDHTGFTLVYLWYNFDSEEARKHEEEIEKFTAAVTPEVDFKSMKYQDLFENITKIPGIDKRYVDYLRERYF